MLAFDAVSSVVEVDLYDGPNPCFAGFWHDSLTISTRFCVSSSLSSLRFEELLAQDGIALPDADHIAAKEADVLGLVPLCDQLEKVEFGADPAASGTNGLLCVTRTAVRSEKGVMSCVIRIA